MTGRVSDQRWTTSTPTSKDHFGYGYDRDSNRLYKENLLDLTRSELYVYDNLNQLSSMQRGTLNVTKTGLTGAATRSQSWSPDAIGNFNSQTTDGTTQTRGHNKQNEITSISGATTPTYDANGNLTKDETGRTFKYDSWNRLVEVKNSGGTTLATYKWDGMDRRVRETRGATTTDLYYSDQWQVLEERVGTATKLSYVWSPVYVDAMIARDRDTDGNGSLDERLYVVQDANFNVTALVDTTGAVVERYIYDAYGVFTVLTGTWGTRASSSYAWTYLHQGGRWDADGGIYSFRNREYSPTLGRWVQVDPIGFGAGDVVLYRAYRANSIRFVDPMGLDEKEAMQLLSALSAKLQLLHNGVVTTGMDKESIQDRAGSIVNNKLWLNETKKTVAKVTRDTIWKAININKKFAATILKELGKTVVKDANKELWDYLNGGSIEQYSLKYDREGDINKVSMALIWDRDSGNYVAIISGQVSREIKNALVVKNTSACGVDAFEMIIIGEAPLVKQRFGGTKVDYKSEKITWIKP